MLFGYERPTLSPALETSHLRAGVATWKEFAGVEMALEKNSGEDAKALSDSAEFAPNGAAASVAKVDGSKPSVDEIRRCAYEIFQARHGGLGNALEDWQKAEASVSANASKADAPKAEDARPDASGADASKGLRIPTDTGTIQETLTKFHSSLEYGLTQQE